MIRIGDGENRLKARGVYGSCRSNVIMSGISKIKMSGFILNRVRFSFTKESLHEEGHFKDESKRD